ncbi:MAG TPA: TspO/MBR family protein [Pedobacter sp.]|jgi:tryptophan-rich sensory protein
MKNIIRFIISITIPLVVGGVSGYATSANISSWYAYLNKPSFNPPNYLFGPVWTFLYLLMGISLYLVWKSPEGKQKTRALLVFAFQLLLNFAWSFIFFSFHETGLALVEIIVLWMSILLMIILFFRINRTAAYLQIPYLLWVSFATALNAAIWHLN